MSSLVPADAIRALTVRPPWSYYIATGVKRVENRTYRTRYRGPLVIHAARALDPAGFATGAALGHPVEPEDVARGEFIAVADLLDVHLAGVDCQPACRGWGQPERWHWLLGPVTRLTTVEGRGQLGLFRPPDEVIEQVLAQKAVTGRYAPVDHPGVAVPSAVRSWSAPWRGYAPVDITPPELRPAGLAGSVAKGWAEPYASPDDVPDWPARQAAALISYERDERGWPLNPTGRTGRTGRNLGKWGENQAADPIVAAGTGTDRRVLLIKRRDRGVWAIPGGMVDPGETAPAALVRELREETGVDLAEATPEILTRTYVADWRTTDHAWICSTVALYRLPEQRAATAGDDAADARWWPAADLDALTRAVEAAGGCLYEAHRPLLAAALDRLTQD